jgi:hypothetical protein
MRLTAAAISSALALSGSKVVCAEPTSTEPHLYSHNALKRGGNPAHAAFAMHSFNRQHQHVLHDISSPMEIDAYTLQGYSSWPPIFRPRKVPILPRPLLQTLHPAHHSHTLNSGPMERNGRLAQLVRAPALQAGCRGFESLTAHQIIYQCFTRVSTLPEILRQGVYSRKDSIRAASLARGV